MFKRCRAGLIVFLVGIILGVVSGFALPRVANSIIEVNYRDYGAKKYEMPSVDPRAGESVNFLLLGSDSRNDGLAARSDSIMVAHVPSSRDRLFLLSIPRDLLVEVAGYGQQKVNAAYSFEGAGLTAQTVGNLLGVPLDYILEIDFNGFISMIDSVGGVTIDNPFTGYDSGQNVSWQAGKVELNSEKALQYVRWRKGLPNGDIDRAANQQRVLKAVAGKIMGEMASANNSRKIELFSKAASNMTVDSRITPAFALDFYNSMKIHSVDDIQGFIYPIKGFESHPYLGSVDVPDEKRGAELSEAFKTDTVGEYVDRYKHKQA